MLFQTPADKANDSATAGQENRDAGRRTPQTLRTSGQRRWDLCLGCHYWEADDFNRRQKPVARSRHRLDEARLAAVVAQRLAHQRDGPGQSVVSHAGVVPHAVQQFLLGNQAARILHQVQQQPERLRLQRDRNAVLSEPQLGVVDLEGCKAVNQDRCLLPRSPGVGDVMATIL